MEEKKETERGRNALETGKESHLLGDSLKKGRVCILYLTTSPFLKDIFIITCKYEFGMTEL